MGSDKIRVSKNYKTLVNSERKKLAKQLGVSKSFFSDAIISEIIANKLSGKQSKLRISKKKVVILA
jgi:hypothetical protein